MSIPEYMLGVGRLSVVRSYVSCGFTVSDGYIPIRLAYTHTPYHRSWMLAYIQPVIFYIFV